MKLPGVIFERFDYTADSAIVETLNGAAFGVAVSQGLNDRGVVVGGTSATFRGIVIRDVAANLPLHFVEQLKTVAILTRGKVWVRPNQSVKAGDPVHFDTATGALGNHDGELIPGARWETSGPAGMIGLVFVPQYRAVA